MLSKLWNFITGNAAFEQLNAALKAVYLLEQQFGEIELYQHSELDTAKPYCAGINMEKFRNNYQIYKILCNEDRSWMII